MLVMPKAEKDRFILNLKLGTEKWQEDILSKRFEIGRKIYNALLGEALNRLIEMTKTKIWRNNQQSLNDVYKKYENKLKKCHKAYSDDQEKLKKELKKIERQGTEALRPLYKVRNDMLKQYNLSGDYCLDKAVKPMQHRFKENIDSHTAQKIGIRVCKAIKDVLFGDGEEVHFKGINNPLGSLEAKTNASGMRFSFENQTFSWNGLTIPVEIDENNMYEMESLILHKVCYCRITRRFVRGKYKYTLQLVLEGFPPLKRDQETGAFKNKLGNGICGIDIGTQTIAYTHVKDAKLLELAPGVVNIDKEKRRIQRYLDRSKRTNNPQNYNDNGTIKKGIKLRWYYSKRYKKAKDKLKDLQRKIAAIRRLDHNRMTNEIVRNCDTVLIEKTCFKGLQKRSKKTEKNEKGKFKKKKRFGKSLANKAPAMFLDILENKLKSREGTYKEINTREVRASQYNHLTNEYNKKKLSQRWNYMDYNDRKIKVQRDLYSAFLIKNVMDDLKTIDVEKCTKSFDDFLVFHDREVERLKPLKNVSSMGINIKVS